MKILFLQFPLHPAWGGAEEQTLLLAQGLQAVGHEIFLLSSNRPLVTRFQANNLPARRWWIGWEPTSITALLLFPITFMAASASFLFWFLKLQKIDTLICLTLADKLLATPLARLLGKKVIWIEHTRIGRWLFQNPLKHWYLFLSQKVKVVVPSYFSRNQLLQLGVPIERIKVIYHGIPVFSLPPHPHLTSPLKGEEPNAKAQPSPNDQKTLFTLGYLGRLTAEKGVRVVIKALAQLPSDTNLIIAGSGPAEAALKKLASDLGLVDSKTSVTSPTLTGFLSDIGEEKHHRVKFLGAIDDKAQFFHSIDALVIPSIQAESFGLVALEAMAAGKLVIASRIGALPEIIDDQKTGLLFEPGSSKQLAEKILWVRQKQQEVEKIIQQAHARVATLFSEERMTMEYLKIIR